VAQAAVITVHDGMVEVCWSTQQRRVAPGQSVVFYDPTDTYVLGGGIAH
jgi:tRNA-specific 2-thiouridylase